MTYFTLTGNPFVDAGIYSIEAFYGKSYEDLTPKDLEGKIDNIVDLYLSEGWKKDLYSIFTVNSVYSNPSPSMNKRQNSKDFLIKLLKEFSPLKDSGSCIACGRRDAAPVRKREQIPLTGSGKLINFFAGASEGERYCSVCTFAVQFLPIFLYSVGNRFLLLHSISPTMMRFWAKKGVKNILTQSVINKYTGCQKDEYKNSENALFHILEETIRDLEDIFPEKNPSITAYIFSNYTQNPPPMDIIHLPNNVFRFLVYVQRLSYSSWKELVNRGFKNSRKNEIYTRLLSGKSIVQFFIKRDRTTVGNWDVFSYYLKEVRKMDKKRLETIKKVGDKIADYIQKTDNTKILFSLERANTYESLRNVFLKITKGMIAEQMDAPLFTTDELIEDLFPEGSLSWKETRDIILFRIYEKLADYLKDKEEIQEEIEEEG